MIRWFKAAALILAGLVLFIIAMRFFSDLPSLENRTRSRAFTDTADTRIGQAASEEARAHPGLTGLYPLNDAPDAFAMRMLLARGAERSIDAQYYIWHGDITGTLLFNELRAAADRGVRVRLLQDDNTTKGLDETLAALDAHPNIEVRLFNPFVIRSPRWIGYVTDFARLNRRMHNKSFTVDNQATVIGGRNIGDEYFGAGESGLFVDLDMLAIGAAVQDVSADFDRYWASASAYPADRILPRVSPTQLAEIEARATRIVESGAARRYVEAVEALPIVEQLAAHELPLIWAPVRLVSDDPAKALGQAGAEGLLITRIDELLERPEERLGVVSGYFVPTEAGVNTFTAMAGRGVQVDIVTNAFEATDVRIVHSGYVDSRKPLLEAGVRLWELRRTSGNAPRSWLRGSGGSSSTLGGSATALHAKTFTIDTERVFVGSFNFDPRSARLNTELGFVIESPELTRRMEEGIARVIPALAYQVVLSGDGKLVWIERHGDEEIRHTTEPGTTWWQRTATFLLSKLPIEWLL